MRELLKRLKSKYLIIALVLVSGFALLHIAPVVKAATTDSSPAIYDKTYIDALETKLTNLIKASQSSADYEKKISTLESELTALKGSMTFKIIKLQAGQTLIGGESTEIIVRNKDRVTAYVSASATGGISNLISGKDIKNGQAVPDNQLLLIPKADGRGLIAKSAADIMIKGTYTIK